MYGIYAYVRKNTGFPYIMVFTKKGRWSKDLKQAAYWGTREEVEGLLSTLKLPPHAKNIWWFKDGGGS